MDICCNQLVLARTLVPCKEKKIHAKQFIYSGILLKAQISESKFNYREFVKGQDSINSMLGYLVCFGRVLVFCKGYWLGVLHLWLGVLLGCAYASIITYGYAVLHTKDLSALILGFFFPFLFFDNRAAG